MPRPVPACRQTGRGTSYRYGNRKTQSDEMSWGLGWAATYRVSTLRSPFPMPGSHHSCPSPEICWIPQLLNLVYHPARCSVTFGGFSGDLTPSSKTCILLLFLCLSFLFQTSLWSLLAFFQPFAFLFHSSSSFLRFHPSSFSVYQPAIFSQKSHPYRWKNRMCSLELFQFFDTL